MQEKRSPFQMIVFGVFAFAIIAGVLAFAALSGSSENTDIGEVTLWGTFDENIFEAYLRTLNDTDSRAQNISYVEIPEATFQARLVEALASGTGPDAFFIDQSHLIRHWDKIQPISYELMDERTFKDTFIDESELYLSTAGIRALPMVVDPLVLYWNRDILAEAGFANPPQYWDEFVALSQRVTQKDKANNIQRSAVALGEFDNITHAKDIIATLVLQAGGNIVGKLEGQLYAGLSPQGGAVGTISPAQSALRFYTIFADPVKTAYSWNRSKQNSLDEFAQGKLALYVGYASDYQIIQAKNAHLNFDVTMIPQIRSGESKRTLTFGTMYAIAVPRAADNIYGGTQVALFLTDQLASKTFADAIGIPSARRDVLSDAPNDAVQLIFRNSALLARGWLDPHAEETTKIFRRMVGDVTSGALRLSDTIEQANQELRVLINSF